MDRKCKQQWNMDYQHKCPVYNQRSPDCKSKLTKAILRASSSTGARGISGEESKNHKQYMNFCHLLPSPLKWKRQQRNIVEAGPQTLLTSRRNLDKTSDEKMEYKTLYRLLAEPLSATRARNVQSRVLSERKLQTETFGDQNLASSNRSLCTPSGALKTEVQAKNNNSVPLCSYNLKQFLTITATNMAAGGDVSSISMGKDSSATDFSLSQPEKPNRQLQNPKTSQKCSSEQNSHTKSLIHPYKTCGQQCPDKSSCCSFKDKNTTLLAQLLVSDDKSVFARYYETFHKRYESRCNAWVDPGRKQHPSCTSNADEFCEKRNVVYGKKDSAKTGNFFETEAGQLVQTERTAVDLNSKSNDAFLSKDRMLHAQKSTEMADVDELEIFSLLIQNGCLPVVCANMHGNDIRIEKCQINYKEFVKD